MKLLNAYSISVHISLQSIRYYLQEKGLATHSSTLSCLGNPMDRGAWRAIVHGVAKNTGMGCHSLHQEIFPTQGSNPGPLHCRRIFFFFFNHLSHQGSQKVSESTDQLTLTYTGVVGVSQVVLVVKNPPAKAGDKRHGFNPWVGSIPWKSAWQPTLIFLPRESHGQRTLVGYRPQGCKELATTEAT